MTLETSLNDVVAQVIDRHRYRPKISPTWIATEAMTQIDPERRSVEMVYSGCHLHLRQVARQMLAHIDPMKRKLDETGELFEDDLQWRYPSARQSGDEPEYVLLDSLTDDDYELNIARLRKEGSTKLRHADRLEAHWNSKRSAA
jgi:hypothetical protein